MEEVKVHNKINAITVVVVSNLPSVKESQDDDDDNDDSKWWEERSHSL